MSALSSLQDLNLAGNKIEKVEISYLNQLKVLNISGNPITSLKVMRRFIACCVIYIIRTSRHCIVSLLFVVCLSVIHFILLVLFVSYVTILVYSFIICLG